MIKQEWKSIPVSQLELATWNYKTDDEVLDEKLRANLEKNGIIQNLIVRHLDNGQFEVVNGNHRLKILREASVDSVMCCDLGTVSQKVAERIAVETNETAYRTDSTKLASIIEGLELEFGLEDLVSTMPYTAEDIGAMKDMLKFDFDSLESRPEDLKASDGDWKTVSLRLPEGVADQFEDQILRLKKAINPGQVDYDEVSPVLAIEAITQHIAQIPDEDLI